MPRKGRSCIMTRTSKSGTLSLTLTPFFLKERHLSAPDQVIPPRLQYHITAPCSIEILAPGQRLFARLSSVNVNDPGPSLRFMSIPDCITHTGTCFRCVQLRLKLWAIGAQRPLILHMTNIINLWQPSRPADGDFARVVARSP
jgi:hypothetical protein